MPRPLSPFSRGFIIASKIYGKPPQECQDQLNSLQIRRQCKTIENIETIRNIYRQFDQGKIDIDYSNCGRSKKYDEEQENLIIDHFQENPQATLRSVQKNEEINTGNLSKSTISSILNNDGIHAYKRPKIMLINEDQKQRRYTFAKQHFTWSRKWKRVLFSDECILERGLVGNQFLWYESRQEIQFDQCLQQEKYPKNRIHIWGLISYNGPLYIEQIQGKLNKEEYCKMLDRAFQSLDDGYLSDKIFQQDLAKCHTSAFTKNYLKSINLELMDWMPKGADISPIERIWANLKGKLQDLDYENLTKEELYNEIEVKFYEDQGIQKQIQKLYESLPEKIQQIIENKGDQINI